MRPEIEIRKLLNRAHGLAYSEVKRRAIEIMQKHKNLSHFCMSMGTACFYERGESIEVRHYTKSLLRFVEEFDRELYLTGSPLRLERKGDTIEFEIYW